MATSAEMSTSNTRIKYTISVTAGGSDAASNATSVNVQVRFYRTNTGYESYGTGTVYCKIDGATYSAAVTPAQKITNSGIVLFNQNVIIPHNSDGTKTLTCSAWISHDVVTSSEQSYSQALPTIYRASVPTLSALHAVMGEAITITTNRKSSAFTHTLKYTIGATTVTMATGVGASYKWTVPDLAANINNTTQAQMVITCVTYNGSTVIGTNTVPFTVYVQEATVPSFPNGVVIGAGNPITTNAGSKNFTHTITYSFNGKTGYVNSEKVKSGIVWWTPYELASAIPNDTSGTGTITCTTYNGTAKVGEKTISFTATVPDNDTTKPAFTDDGFVLTPSGTVPSAFSGLYIQGKTGVKAAFTASSAYSTVASHKLSADGRVYTGNPAESQILTKDGNIDVTGTVYDARGYYTQRSKTITVYPYRTPSIEPYDGDSSIICERSDGSGNYIDSGTYLHIRAKRIYAPVNVGGFQKNICHLQYRYKIEGGSWTSPVNILSGSNTSTDLVDVELTDVVTQTDKSYAVELIVTDTMGAVERYSFTIGTDKVTFHLREGGRGAAFGKYSEGRDNLLECDWDFEVNKDLYANHIARRGPYDGLDFDELIYHTGYYASNSSPGTAGCSNYPVDQTGVLEVISQITVNESTGNVWGFAYQTYRTHTGAVYTRSYYTSNGWSAWALQDGIVEQGTSDIWTYVKYSSGLAECWGRRPVTADVTTAWGTMFYAVIGEAVLPFAFAEAPICNVSLEFGVHSNSAWLGTYGKATTTMAPAVTICRASQAEQKGYTLAYHAKGRWK